MTKRTLSENLDLTLDYDAYRITAPVVTVNGNSIAQNLSTTGSPVFSNITVGSVANVGALDVDTISCSGSTTVSGPTVLAGCTADSITSTNGVITNVSTTNINAISSNGISCNGSFTATSLSATNGGSLPNSYTTGGIYLGSNSGGLSHIDFVNNNDSSINFLSPNSSTPDAKLESSHSGGNFLFSVGGNPVWNVYSDKKMIFYSSFINIPTANTPANSTTAGVTGDICWDSGYIYVCVATNTWKRVALTSW